jgi:ATP-binding cassette subfamily B protein
VQFSPTKASIEIQDLCFRYDGDGDYIFKDFNLHIKGGEHVGIVGMSGAGKSTLASLLMRFDDISSGSITVDGVDIRSVTQSSLRQHIAYVPQEPVLFHRTVCENIAYHNPNASQEDIILAAKAAHAHEFITKLPSGYDTVVGERGVKLSGGQKQRVVIARAVLKNAAIILFDEATSALDSESEAIIQQALPNIIGKHTAIIIAHRLSTVARLDRIIVMHNGTIEQQGTHKQLLASKGRYYKLWLRQTTQQE